jgi:26S proteasome regulatory subunit N7
VKENEMGPFYEYACQEAGVPLDKGLLRELATKNEKRVKELEAEIEDAEKNLGLFYVL